MASKINRRKFFKKSTQAGIACCAMMLSSKLIAGKGIASFLDDEKIDPKKLNFCGYTCPADCKFYIATVENDVAKKKEAYEIWHIKERYGVDFDPETAICWRCKNFNKPEGVVIKHCTVRSCAIEKGYDACIQCNTLTSCEKDLWKRFPEFYNAVKEMQVKYMEQIAS
ncbi:MAG TPA: DUF3795 domain-containing protein [Bacteroidales bacterium]|nr:DUF3795 domain-containing protein [Bacteroidales bacterium]